MTAVFASDLHLNNDALDKVSLFEALLEQAAQLSYDVYLLGDVFEIWLGDDDDTPPNSRILAAMHAFTSVGKALYVMRGNRDFLFGDAFVATTGATMLTDFHELDLNGVPTLLTHGDLLCTKDVKYQQFRQFVRDPSNQQKFLAAPLPERRQIAAQTRTGTQASMLEKDEFIMDVEQLTVERVMQQYGVARLIHGHTHRPQTHTFSAQGTPHERIVLGDWYNGCSIVVYDDAGIARLTASEFVNQ